MSDCICRKERPARTPATCRKCGRKVEASCAIPTCLQDIDRKMLMCSSHWAKVPYALQRKIWRELKKNGVGSDEYEAAVKEAIEFVTTPRAKYL